MDWYRKQGSPYFHVFLKDGEVEQSLKPPFTATTRKPITSGQTLIGRRSYIAELMYAAVLLKNGHKSKQRVP